MLSTILLDDFFLLLTNGLIFTAFLWLLFTRKTAMVAVFLFIIMPVERGGPLLLLNTGLAKFLLTVFLFIAINYNKKEFPNNICNYKVGYLLIFLSLIHLTAFILSIDKVLSSQYIFFFFTSIISFFVFCSVFDRTFLKRALMMILISTYVACGLGILQYLIVKYNFSNSIFSSLIPYEMRGHSMEITGGYSSYPMRFPSFFFHNNGFGHFLSVVFGIHFSMLFFAKKKKDQILYFTAVLSVLVACLLTLSRGSSLVIFSEGLAILYILRKKLFRKEVRFVTIGVSFLLIGYFLFRPNLYALVERIQTAGLANRDVNWEYALLLLPRHYLLGAGPGMCSYHMLSSFPFPSEYLGRMVTDLSVTGKINWYISHAHNFYLNTLIETGIFSLIVYALLFWTIIGKGIRIYTITNHALIKALIVGSLVPLCGGLIRGFFESYVFFCSSYVGYLISFYFALILYLEGLHLVHPTKAYFVS